MSFRFPFAGAPRADGTSAVGCRVSYSARFAKGVALGLMGVALAMTGSEAAKAGTVATWNGVTNTGWATNTNWTPTTTLNNSTTYSLVFSGTKTSNSNNVGVDGSTVTLDSILFANDRSTAALTGNFTVASSGSRTITLTNGATVTAVDLPSFAQSGISSNVIASGTINIFTGSNNGLNFQSGTITGSPVIVKTGQGSLNFGGSQAASGRLIGGLNIKEGQVAVSTGTALAMFPSTVSLGSSTSAGAFVPGISGTTNSGIQFALNGSGSVGNSSSSAMVYTAATFNQPTAATSATLTLSQGSNTTQIQGGIVDNTGGPVSVNVVNGGVKVLSGSSSYTGSTSIGPNAKVLLDGSLSTGGVSVVGGFLGGSGSMAGAVSVTGTSITTGTTTTLYTGTIAPGGSSTGGVITDSIASLRVGSLSMVGDATALLAVTGTGSAPYDQIIGSNAMTFGSVLGLTMSGSYGSESALLSGSQTWSLFNSFSSYTPGLTSITLNATGTPFAGLTFGPTGTTGIWQTGFTSLAPDAVKLQFNENTGVLAVVPEPTQMVFVAGVGAALGAWRMRKLRRNGRDATAC